MIRPAHIRQRMAAQAEVQKLSDLTLATICGRHSERHRSRLSGGAIAGVVTASVIVTLLMAGLMVASCCGLLPCCRPSRPHKQCATPLALTTYAVHY